MEKVFWFQVKTVAHVLTKLQRWRTSFWFQFAAENSTVSSLQEPFSFSVSIYCFHTLCVGVWHLFVLTNNHVTEIYISAENWNQKTMFRLNASVVISVKEKHLGETSAETLLSCTYAGANWNWIWNWKSIDAAFLVNIPLGQSYLTAYLLSM